MERKNAKGAARNRGTRRSDVRPFKALGNSQMLSAREMKRIGEQIAHMETAERRQEQVQTSGGPAAAATAQRGVRDSVPRSSHPNPIAISSHGHGAQAQVTPPSPDLPSLPSVLYLSCGRGHRVLTRVRATYM